MIASLVIAAVLVALDQLTKILIYTKVEASIIGDFLRIESTLNTGASFGIMEDSLVFFIIITIPVMAAMVYVICSKKYLNIFNKICLGVVLGGTLGNFIDRCVFKGVRDFIALKGFAVFNVADIAITVGVFMFIIGLIVQIVKSEKEGKDKQPAKESAEDNSKLEGLKAIRDELKAETEIEKPEKREEDE